MKFLLPIVLTFLYLNAKSQDIVRVDLTTIVQSGVCITYEHYFSKTISAELVVRNAKLDPQYFGIFSQKITTIYDVGRENDVMLSMKYNFKFKKPRHNFGVGLGLLYVDWYNVSQEYKKNYIEFYNAETTSDKHSLGVMPFMEYNYYFKNSIGIGFKYPFRIVGGFNPFFVNLSYIL